MADYAISNVPRRVVYAASGTGPYAFTFEILSQTDIAVYKASTLLTLTTDYTVTINANGTGSVTLVVTAGTSNITIVGAKNIQRTTDFTTGGDLFANTLNDELDNQTIFIQQVAETAERGLKAPVTDPIDIAMNLPAKADRASKYLGFDSNGNPVASSGTGTTVVSTAMEPVVSAATLAAGRTNLGLGSIATQAANAVAITGGAIDGTTIGTTTRSSVKATTLDLGLSTQSVAIGQGNSSLMKNRIINGNFYVAQRATSATITAGSTIAAGYATVDRFYGYCTGANVTMAQVAGAGNNRNLLQFTGAASVTAIGCGQRIESLNSYDLAGQTVTLSAFIANSLLTSVTWTAYYANTTDTFGTLASPTRTQIATGTFTVTSTLTQYSAQIAIPLAATTGIEIVFTVGAQTSGTWQLDRVQLEAGSFATGYEYRQYTTELALCQRYYQSIFGQNSQTAYISRIYAASAGIGAPLILQYKVSMRIAPTVTRVGTWITFNITGQPSFAGITTEATYMFGAATAAGDAGFYTDSASVGVTFFAEL